MTSFILTVVEKLFFQQLCSHFAVSCLRQLSKQLTKTLNCLIVCLDACNFSTASSCSSIDICSSSEGESQPNWIINFSIPWQKCSTVLIDALKKGEVPPAYCRREFVHIVVDEVFKVCLNVM